MNFISIAKKSAGIQISELRKINKIFNKSFSQAMNVISGCKGKVIFTGQGKSGKQALSISSTMSSVGIPSFYIHPSETSHGDSGAIQRKDVLVVISFSGNTPELKNVIQHANRFGIKIIGCSSNKSSMLSKASDIKIILPKVKEADPIGMVPTTSTAITLLYFNCLAIAKLILSSVHQGMSCSVCINGCISDSAPHYKVHKTCPVTANHPNACTGHLSL